MGHLGKDRALQLIRDPSYWFKMEDDVTSFCYQSLQLCPEKEIAHSCCCTHAFVFFSSTIRVNWFRFPPSWHIQWWVPVFACAYQPFLKVCPSISNNK